MYEYSRRELEFHANKKLEKMREILKEKNKTHTNTYRDIDFEISNNKDGFPQIVYILTDSAKWINTGRGPGKMPPEDVISEWLNYMGLPESMLWPVRIKIGDLGIPPTNFLNPIYKDTELKEIMEKSLAKDIKKMFEEKFGEENVRNL
jgi:hypothetical protein